MFLLIESCKDAHDEIMNSLGDGKFDINDEMKISLEDLRLYGEDFLIYKSIIDVSRLSSDVLKQVIGRDGYYFILTTRVSKIDFIWHNMERNTIEFWGPSVLSLKKAMYEIHKRIKMKLQYDNGKLQDFYWPKIV